MKVAAWIAAIVPAVAVADGLVGSTIPPYPAGVLHEQGTCIADCDFSIGILEDASSVPKTLFGARLAGRDESGKARWTVTDALPFPAMPEGFLLALATCEVDGKQDETIVAAVRGSEVEEWLEDVVWARRFDLATGKFVEHASQGVRCLNEGWGL
jgi:hypothetical protein